MNGIPKKIIFCFFLKLVGYEVMAEHFRDVTSNLFDCVFFMTHYLWNLFSLLLFVFVYIMITSNASSCSHNNIGNNVIIRNIVPQDNKKMASIIISVLESYDAPKEGTAAADASVLENIYETYQAFGERSGYFVCVDDDEVVGGCGIGHLPGEDETVSELQKMYFVPEARGKGYGQRMLQHCCSFAKQCGYKSVYLETLENMKEAQRLYVKAGFKYIKEPLGDTGHTSCPIRMLKQLDVDNYDGS